MMLVEGEEKCFWFVSFVLPVHLLAITPLALYNAEFAFVQYFDLKLWLENDNKVLNFHVIEGP